MLRAPGLMIPFWTNHTIYIQPSSKLFVFSGGEGGIRTHGTRKGSTVFETARFNHSRTSPLANLARMQRPYLWRSTLNPQPQRLRVAGHFEITGASNAAAFDIYGALPVRRSASVRGDNLLSLQRRRDVQV